MGSILYYVRQDKRRNGTMLWYGKAFVSSKLDLEKVAERIEQVCSMKKSDVYGYLIQLVEEMKRALQQGYKVKLGNLGYFHIVMRTKGSISEEKFNINENLAGTTVSFQTVNERTDGTTTRAVLGNHSYMQIPNPYKGQSEAAGPQQP